jgi:hypothetical protein
MRWPADSPVVFAAVFAFVFLLHLPLLKLPYFWDEAGYYIPAARDIFLGGRLIPTSTVSNAHPPLVMIWLALWWKLVGFAPVVTRSAMLVIAAFSLAGVFRLANLVANTKVAIASTVCTALYPVFFAQSSLAQIDLAAAGFTFWGMAAYLEKKAVTTALWFTLAVLSKETAVLAPAALAAWEIVGLLARRSSSRNLCLNDANERDEANPGQERSNRRYARNLASLIIPVIPLCAWYFYHYLRTGFVFGNPEFFRYNVAATLNPTRFVLALVLRVWQVCGYLHLWVLTAATLVAMWVLEPQSDSGFERPPIGIQKQMVFYVVIFTYVVAMALIGGAVLARYMLPAVPLMIILCVSTLCRRLHYWSIAVGLIALAFVLAWFWNPPYGFSPEDNLAYRDYIILHQDAEQLLEARYPMARVLTAWPASDEISRPWLGYITRPMQVVRIENFSAHEIIAAAAVPFDYDAALVFSTKYEAAPAVWDRWRGFAELRRRWKSRFFGYHRDLPAEAVAHLLGGRIVFSEQRHGQWIAVIEMERLQEARKIEEPSPFKRR